MICLFLRQVVFWRSAEVILRLGRCGTILRRNGSNPLADRSANLRGKLPLPPQAQRFRSGDFAHPSGSNYPRFAVLVRAIVWLKKERTRWQSCAPMGWSCKKMKKFSMDGNAQAEPCTRKSAWFRSATCMVPFGNLHGWTSQLAWFRFCRCMDGLKKPILAPKTTPARSARTAACLQQLRKCGIIHGMKGIARAVVFVAFVAFGAAFGAALPQLPEPAFECKV